jgi:hypothetical protein
MEAAEVFMRPLALVSAGVAASGVVLWGLAASPAHPLLAAGFGPFAWPEPAPAEIGAWGRIGLVIAGALTAGWGVSLHQVAVGRSDRASVAGLLTWFVLDSTGSVTTGWVGNVALNVLFALAFVAAFVVGRRTAPAPIG